MLNVLRKMRFWLYGVRFVVEIDAKTLVHQLNLPGNDFPGALLTSWLALIGLFDYDIRHTTHFEQAEYGRGRLVLSQWHSRGN